MNADAETDATSRAEEHEADDHAYFQAVEEIFVRLRGAPLLLSPADWQVARRWHRQGIPLDLVRRALEEVFARRRERGLQGRISSLRYCAHAIEAAWSSWSEMMAPGLRGEAPALDVAGRLAALAAALAAALVGLSHGRSPRGTGRRSRERRHSRLVATGPGAKASAAPGKDPALLESSRGEPDLPETAGQGPAPPQEPGRASAPPQEPGGHPAAPLDPETWRGRVVALTALGRDAQRIEERLAELDGELLDAALAALPGGRRANLDAAVEKTLASLSGRIPAGDLEPSRGRLRRQVLRQRLGLPLLSLFSPEAAPEPAPEATPEPAPEEDPEPDPRSPSGPNAGGTAGKGKE